MNNWITIRTFLALFLMLFGIALMFSHAEGGRILLGVILAAIGSTFMVRLAIALRRD